jgi:hypothetical protein
MSCCGQKRANAVASAASTDRAARRTFLTSGAQGVSFEYVGARALTVIGQGTGYQYRFIGYGARVAVDPRDRVSLAAVPSLREVRA